MRVYIRVGDGCQLLAVLSERMQRVEREKHERAARQRKALQAAEAAAAKQAARRGRSSTHSHVRRAPSPLIHTRTDAYTHTPTMPSVHCGHSRGRAGELRRGRRASIEAKHCEALR